MCMASLIASNRVAVTSPSFIPCLTKKKTRLPHTSSTSSANLRWPAQLAPPDERVRSEGDRVVECMRGEEGLRVFETGGLRTAGVRDEG